MLYLFLLFLVSLVVFQGLSRTYNITRKYWVSTDYVWVALAIITLTAKGVELRKIKYQADIQMHAADLSNAYMRALEQTNFLENHLEQRGSSAQVIQWFGNYEATIAASHDELLRDFNPKIWEKVYDFNKTLPTSDKKILDMKKPFDMELQIIDSKIAIISNDKHLATETYFEKLLFSITPYLFAIAIALRLTKVSYDVRNATRND